MAGGRVISGIKVPLHCGIRRSNAMKLRLVKIQRTNSKCAAELIRTSAKPAFQFLRLENRRQSLCFGNASLQMIWVAEPVRKLIQAYRGKDEILQEVSSIFNSASGKACLAALRKLLPGHLHKGHQDAMEFLQYAILDRPYPELKALFQYSVHTTTRCSKCTRKHSTVVKDSILICGITEESVKNGKWNFRAAINDLDQEIKVEHWNCNHKKCRGRDIECRKIEKYDMTNTKYFLVQLKLLNGATKKKVRIEDLHLDDMEMFGFHWRVLSTIEHVGSRNSGHYTAFVRHPSEPGWLRLDDAKAPERWRLDPELKNHYLFLFEKIEASRIVVRNCEEDRKMLDSFSTVEVFIDNLYFDHLVFYKSII
ncbi:hypothetical protein DdX_15013 [Ditylenchus destructor]|uniref:ubiquitinyl hydrolase 1 n=1 Tax=Ditylenchus destructor TaxID=166010 RepID=A0AAD4MTD9_9BILA|nr:hypothetical protein DdX_15013 [Ditylenchus destructor]